MSRTTPDFGFREPTAYHGPIDIDARDSDRMELPDAPDASRNNAPMLIVVACVAFPLLLALVIQLVRLSLGGL
jgi:hypothetical protein